MEVRSGIDPENEDTNVRFRTTYYFRVFDYCEDDFRPPNYGSIHTGRVLEVEPKRARRIEIDSLYRFRMTGKANALSNKVHFESGTLKSFQIDPFGASIQFDGDRGRFDFVSQDESRQEKTREDTYREIARLRALRDGYDPESEKDAIAAINRVILQRIGQLGGSIVPETRSGTSSASQALEAASVAQAEATAAVAKLPVADQGTLNSLLSPLDDLPNPAIQPNEALAKSAEDHRKAAQGFDDKAQAIRLLADTTLASHRTPQKQADWAGKSKEYAAAVSVLRGAVAATKETTKEINRAKKLVIQAADLLAFGPRFKWASSDAANEGWKYLERVIAEAKLDSKVLSTLPDSVSFLKSIASISKTDEENRERAAALQEAANALGGAAVKLASAAGNAAAEAAGSGRGDGSKPLVCGDGLPVRRGFQVLGPEGWRTFDQDDRLIMAMSSEAKPLISALQEISGRMLREQQPSSEQVLLPVVQERLRVSKTLHAVETSKDTDPEEVMRKALSSFGVDVPKKADSSSGAAAKSASSAEGLADAARDVAGQVQREDEE